MSQNQDPVDEQMQIQVSFERERMFAEKLANVFLFDNKVQVSQGAMNIAYCNVNQKKIWFNFPEIFSGSDLKVFKEMMTFKGLGFHEILHLKYTMKSKRRMQNELMALLQRLEDGRIETLGVLEYQKLADYLIFAVNNVLLKDKDRILKNVRDEIINTYILCYGRSIYFQDVNLMAKIREMIIKSYGKEVAEKIEDCIDRYIPETNSEQRINIAQELYDFLSSKNIRPDFQRQMVIGFLDDKRIDPKTLPKEIQEALKQMPQVVVVRQEIKEELEEKTKDVKDSSDKRDEFEKKKQEQMDNLRKERRKKFEEMYDEKDKDKREEKRKEISDIQDEMQDLKDKTFNPDEDEDMDDAEDSDADSDMDGDMDGDSDLMDDEDMDGDSDSDSGDGDEDSDGDGDGDGDSDGDSDDDSDEDGDGDSSGDGSGKGYSPDGKDGEHKDLDDMIDDKEDEQEDLVDKHRDDLKGDLKSMGRSIDDVYADASFTVDGRMQTMANELEKGLKKLNNELVKGYVAKQKAGRVNIKRFINRQTITDTKVFNKWLPDRLQQTKLLVNLFVDGSGSMSGERWKKAINSCWVINEALNRDENKIMVYQFSDGHQLVKEYDQPLTVPKMIGQGTYPASAINDAIPRIEAYRKAKSYRYVVNIIITDGEFDNNESDEQISRLNQLGHETILIHISSIQPNRGMTPEWAKHKAKHYLALNSFDVLVPELVKVFTDIKKVLIRKAKVL